MQRVLHQPQHHLQANVSHVKHDIRNQLSALKLNVYLLQRQGHPEQLSALEAMREELGEINSLLEDLADSHVNLEES